MNDENADLIGFVFVFELYSLVLEVWWRRAKRIAEVAWEVACEGAIYNLGILNEYVDRINVISIVNIINKVIILN